MQSQLSEISPVEVTVTVEVPWDRVEKGLDESFKHIARTAKVRGFRPGKVPRHVVRQLFGKQVKAEVTANLVEAGLLHAVEEHELQVVSQPKVEPEPITKGQPLKFVATVEIRPTIDKVEVDGLEIWRPAAEVLDAEVDHEVERLREQQADIQVPEPLRPAADGDLLTIDYSVSIDGEAKDDLQATDRTVELGSERLIEEFEKGLIGLEVGAKADIDVVFPDDHGSDDLKGKTAIFSVEIKELKEKLLPELDDEFAKDSGDFATLLELRLDIRKRLETAAEGRAETLLKDKLVDALVNANDVPVPPTMLQQQKQQMMYELAQFMQMAGMPPSPDAFDGIDERADRRVRAGILLGALARQEKLTIEPDEIEAKLAEIASETGKHIAKVRVDHAGEKGEALESQLLEKKLMDFLSAKAKINDGPEPETEAASDDGADDDAAAETEGD